MKYLIVGSKTDPASRNIIMNLMDLKRGIDYHIIDGDMLDSRNLNHELIKKFDLVIFASKHESKKKEKTLSIHCPGNFREVWGGGETKRLSLGSALFNKFLFECFNLFCQNCPFISDKKGSFDLPKTRLFI